MIIDSDTTILAAQGIIGMSQELFGMVVVVGALAGLALGIGVGLKNGWRNGMGSAIGGVIGGVVLSIVISIAAGLAASGKQELEQRGVVPHSVYGQ
ncbi:DUF3482 domain-containing protein [Mycolicibacterium goodii]|uniref:DUF3482 domain-containing protein n=1 Tax=Mycolicibacterium goodii TaxID=134601 RepID=UPI001BDC94DC|nr:DUF3482 domain-containing protein [Mycolicibacterium goodii]MBU8841269.1 DUF3482 domain-containing protein [Mycolicibacterium goodii]